MATADQIEKIVLQIEEHGAAGVGIAVTRIDDVLKDLEKRKGPEVAVTTTEKLADALDKTAKSGAAARDALGRFVKQSTSPGRDAFGRFVKRGSSGGASGPLGESLPEATQGVDRFLNSLARRHARNNAIEAVRQDAHQLAQAMRAANRIPTELQQAPKALTAGQKAFQAFSRVAGPRATKGLVATVDVLEKVGPIASKIGPPVASAALAVGAVSLAVGGAAIFAAKEFGGAVIQAQAFREDMRSALDTLLKGKSTGDEALRRASATADFIGQGRADVAGQFTDLAGKFKDVDQIDRIVRSLADLSAVDPKANLESLTRAVGQIQAKGKLSGEELMQLSESGLEMSGVFAQLAKMTGKSMADVQKQISAGKVTSAQGIEAIMMAINADAGGGPAGAAAAKKARNNLSGLLNRVENIPKNILFDVAVGSGIDGVKGFLNDVLDFFSASSASGKEVRKVTGDLFNALIEGLTGNKVDTKKGVTGTLNAVLDGAKTAVPVVKDLAAGARGIASIAASLVGAGAAVSGFLEPLGGIGKVWKTMTLPLRLLAATIVGPLALLPEIFGGFKGLPFSTVFEGLGEGASNAINTAIEKVKAGGLSVFNSALNIGMSLWQGIVQGITGGIGAVTQAATNLANAALGAVGVTWRVGSPAKAFTDLGVWAGPGLGVGIDKGTPSATAAGARLANATLGATMTAGAANMNGGATISSMAGAGGTGQIFLNFSPQIVVSGASSPAQAQAVGEAAVRGARAAWEAQLGETMRRVRYG